MPIFLLKICCCYFNTHVHSLNKFIYDTIKVTKIWIYSHTFDTHLILHSSTSRLFGVNVIERSVLPRIHVAAFWPWPTEFVFVVNNKICSRTKTVYTHTHTCRLQQFAPHFAVNKNCVIIKSDPEKRLRDKQAANWRPEFFFGCCFFLFMTVGVFANSYVGPRADDNSMLDERAFPPPDAQHFLILSLVWELFCSICESVAYVQVV